MANLRARGWRRRWGALGVLALLAGQPADAGFDPAIGNYLNADRVGTGLDVQRVGDTIFVLWFTYFSNGTPIWYLAVGQLDGMTWSGEINRFRWDGSIASSRVVGEMSLTWSDPEHATFSWTLGGNSGEWPVEFLTFAEGTTRIDHTGHYFTLAQPGWGASLLTQGDVTAMFLYFYRPGGEPAWLLGTSGGTGFQQTFTLQLFNGPGLCPACKGQAAEPTADDVVDVTLIDAPLFFTGNRGFDTVATLKGITHDPGSINPGTALGADPLGIIDLPAFAGPEGPFQSLTPATPSLAPEFTEAERDVLVDSLTLDYDPVLFSNINDCLSLITQQAVIDVAENPDAYPVVRRPGGSVVRFLLDDFGFSEPTVMAVRRVGDELIALSWVGFWPGFGLQDGLTLVTPIGDFFEDPAGGMTVQQVLFHRVTGIGGLVQHVARARNAGLVLPDRLCGRVLPTAALD